MSERYWITGVQLGVLLVGFSEYSDVEWKKIDLIKDIIANQFIGNVSQNPKVAKYQRIKIVGSKEAEK